MSGVKRPAASGPTDEALFAAYLDGEQAAFRVLFDRYAPLLTRIFRRRGQPEDDVAESVQQTFLQVHRARLDFRRDARLRPWLIAIGVNVMRQRMRRRRSRPEAELELDGPAPAAFSPPHDPVATDQARHLHAALRQLPEPQRVAIELHWLEGIPFQEVAEIVGASRGAVKVRAHRGYERLREILERQARNQNPRKGN